MLSNTPESRPAHLITQRQRKVLILRACGMEYGDIAKQLFVSTRTVVRDSAQAARALGASNPMALGALAYAQGIVQDEHLANTECLQ